MKFVKGEDTDHLECESKEEAEEKLYEALVFLQKLSRMFEPNTTHKQHLIDKIDDFFGEVGRPEEA